MRQKDKVQRKIIGKVFLAALMVCAIIALRTVYVQGATEKITLSQDHSYGSYDGGDSSYYYLYPNDKYKDYKKFMKFTYKISDDSVIGLRFNGDVNFNSFIVDVDKKGNMVGIYPNDIKVHALGPGTATLKVYDGKKLIDSYTFTVTSDIAYSPSSFVSIDGEYLSADNRKKEQKLLKKFITEAADPKYSTTNQRIKAALDAMIAYDGKLLSEKEYNKILKKRKDDLADGYLTAYDRLIYKNATAEGYAQANRLMLSNMGFQASVFGDIGSAENSLKLYISYKNYLKLSGEFDEEYELYEEDYEEFYESDEEDLDTEINQELIEEYIYFTATNKLKTEYDFSVEDKDSIYNRTHLPAWIIEKDTKQQNISVGQTISLSSSDMNNNLYSTDTSVVKAENGSITGVKPGIAMVYRYNDTYCDVFYVMVKKKGSAKTINGKVYHKSVKTYFKDSDYAPFIASEQWEKKRIQNWESLRLYDLEPIFGHGGKLTTKFSKGVLKCYLEYKGKKDLLCSIGTNEDEY